MGHVLRGNSLLKEVLEGRMEGRRVRGRPRLGMLDEIKVGSYVDMKRKSEDREGWEKLYAMDLPLGRTLRERERERERDAPSSEYRNSLIHNHICAEHLKYLYLINTQYYKFLRLISCVFQKE